MRVAASKTTSNFYFHPNPTIEKKVDLIARACCWEAMG